MVISFIYGPMTAGKTSRILKSYKLGKRYRLGNSIIKPLIDTREDGNVIATHDGKVQKADVYVLGNDKFPPKKRCRMVMVDEAQFFSIEEIEFIIKRCDTYETAFCTFFGLAYDYAQELFPSAAYLMERSHLTEQLPATCAICEDEALNTQRLVNGVPAPFGEKILVGGSDQYEARCSDCYVHPSDVEELF